MNNQTHQSIFGIFLLGGLLIAWFGMARLLESPEAPLERAAAQVLEACRDANYTPGCYDQEIPKLMDRGFSMEEAFRITALVQKEDPEYWYCHVLGHNLSAREAAKDLSKWNEVIARCPVGQCSNGCLHGTFQERFRDQVLSDDELEELLPKLSIICENGPARTFTGLEQSSCYHALGHLAMYITHADTIRATSLCDRIAFRDEEHDFRRVCYDGAFMQIYQPLEPEDFALIEGIAPQTQLDSEKFCNTFSGIKHESCHRESWPLYLENIKNPEGLMNFCDYLGESTERGVRACYNSMLFVLTAHFQLDGSRIFPICEGLSETWKGQCYANAASRILEIDYQLVPKAVSFCEEAERKGVGNRCWAELLFYSTFNFHEGSLEFNTLCEALPEPWSTRCYNGEGTQVKFRDL